MFNFRFMYISSKTITAERIAEMIDAVPRKICFNSCHKTALKKQDHDTFKGTFNIPFKDSVGAFFQETTSLQLFQNPNHAEKYWYSIQSDEDYEKIEKFVGNFKDVVFIRDCLELSIAFSENFTEDDEHTDIAELLYLAKFKEDETATEALIKMAIEQFAKLPLFPYADLICAVPPSKKGKENLPRKIADGIANSFNIVNISKDLNWKADKPQLKEAKIEEKLKILQAIGLELTTDVKNKNVILVDDLYQSGVTIQYCAMVLKEAGAKRIFGLSMVKSRSNTDNIHEGTL